MTLQLLKLQKQKKRNRADETKFQIHFTRTQNRPDSFSVCWFKNINNSKTYYILSVTTCHNCWSILIHENQIKFKFKQLYSSLQGNSVCSLSHIKPDKVFLSGSIQTKTLWCKSSETESFSSGEQKWSQEAARSLRSTSDGLLTTPAFILKHRRLPSLFIYSLKTFKSRLLMVLLL